MAHPYREPPRAAPDLGAGDGPPLSTVIFGVICALGGAALGGPACGILATIAGVVLILAPSRAPR